MSIMVTRHACMCMLWARSVGIVLLVVVVVVVVVLLVVAEVADIAGISFSPTFLVSEYTSTLDIVEHFH